MISAAAGAASVPLIADQTRAAPPQVLRIGMTAADVPTTHGIPNNRPVAKEHTCDSLGARLCI
jgi:hypothetical protein